MLAYLGSLLKNKHKSLRTPDQPPTSMDAILTAILDDDQARVKKLLKADPRLATCLTDAARLYESKIVHWIYVGDTALHLAAAGYRVELVRLLLAAGRPKLDNESSSKRPITLRCRWLH